MLSLFPDFYNLFFPERCQSCQDELTTSEELICLGCLVDLPRVQLCDQPGNLIETIFYGRVKLQFACSLLRYEHGGMAQRLIHQLKYRGREELSYLFGQWMGAELVQCERFPQIDFVVPVPLTSQKQRKRGYNQVSGFGQEIAKSLNTTFIDNQLKAKQRKETQTTKNRYDRWLNVKNQFYSSDPNVFRGKSLLLVDDVITTGATLEACCRALFKSGPMKISIATMAFTS